MISDFKNKNFINSLLGRFQEGDEENSILELYKYIQKYPNDVSARYNLALMYQKTNQIKKSVDEYLIVIKKEKNHWRAMLNLGVLLFANNRFEDSNKYLYGVLKIKKNYQPALRDIGTNFLRLHKYKTAEDILIKALNLNTVDYINMNSLGLTKMYLGKNEDAKKLYEKAIVTNKKYFVSYNNLGLYYESIGKIDDAFECYQKCLKINPKYPNALNNIGMLYFYYEENKKAFECFNKALKIDPKLVDLYFNLGLSYFHMRDFKKAEEYFQKGFNIEPNNYNGHYNYSFMLLAQHKYQNAWEKFDYRLKRSSKLTENFLYKDIKDKIWNNQKLEDKNILVVREQGAGDEILYSSMYRELINLNKNVKIETDHRLINLFKRSFQVEKNFIPNTEISQNKSLLRNIDIIIFAGSLGRKFRQTKEDFYKNNYYLIPEKSLCKKMKLRLDRINSKPKIGISWVSKNKKIGSGKSMNLKSLIGLFNIKKVSFVNLQYGDHSDEIKKFNINNETDIIDLKDIDKFDDFENLAALLKSLDLLITVSNTTAHLSGAIGAETWVMAPKSESLLFYWNTGEIKTPWYSSVKIFPKKTTWEDTIIKIKSELNKWIKKY